MAKKITIIDYGLGNLFSVTKAFEHVGAEVVVSSDIAEIKNSSHLLLPGVGAFNKGMEELQKRGLVQAIKDYAATGKPFMGICLGMQMMFETGEENGTHQGLGLVKGKVSPIPSTAVDGGKLKVPHIGWTKIYKTGNAPQLAGVPEENSFYFVHSYHGICSDEADLAAYALYGGNKLTASVRKGNIFGCQFHPEKSAEFGLQICRDFLAA